LQNQKKEIMIHSTSEDMKKFNRRMIRTIAGVLLAFAALNAFGGGYYGMTGAKGVPVEWLEGSPFSNYFIPGIILFVIVGGSFLFAAIAAFANMAIARKAAIFSVAVVSTWLIVQVAIIGYVSWMQPATAGLSLVILGLALAMK
jgi:hypothetical protein